MCINCINIYIRIYDSQDAFGCPKEASLKAHVEMFHPYSTGKFPFGAFLKFVIINPIHKCVMFHCILM